MLCGCSSKPDTDIYASNIGGEQHQVTFTKRVSHLVEFTYDSFDLPFNAADVVEPHARYLISNPTVKVAIQGNASREGSGSYNFELAKKRAQAVRGLFIELGVDEKQLVVLSIGEQYNSFIPQRSVVLAY